MTRTLPDGHTVKYIHIRDVVDGRPVERGGATYAVVRNTTDEIVVIGVALCRMDDVSWNGSIVLGDQFNKRLGRTISLGRALKAYETGPDDNPEHSYIGAEQIDWVTTVISDYIEPGDDLRP